MNARVHEGQDQEKDPQHAALSIRRVSMKKGSAQHLPPSAPIDSGYLRIIHWDMVY